MGSENISIREDVYEFLKSVKKEGESFSDVILRLKKKGGGTAKDLLEFSGALKDEDIDWEEKEKKISGFRNSWNSRVKNLNNKK